MNLNNKIVRRKGIFHIFSRKSQGTARSFFNQFEQEAEIVGVPRLELLRMVHFILNGSALHWHKSNENKFNTYDEFRLSFVKYYQSDGMVYARLLRLQTVRFDPRTNASVENFVTERYLQMRELDEKSSELQICNNISALLSLLYQRLLSTARIRGLSDLLEVVRKLELIQDKNDIIKFTPGDTSQYTGKIKLDTNKPVNVNEVRTESPSCQDSQQVQKEDNLPPSTKTKEGRHGQEYEIQRKKPCKKGNKN